MQSAAAMGQIVAADPRVAGKAGSNVNGKQAAAGEGKAVEGDGTQATDAAAGEGSKSKSKPTFADQLSSKMKDSPTAEGEQGGNKAKSGETAEEAAHQGAGAVMNPFLPEGLVKAAAANGVARTEPGKTAAAAPEAKMPGIQPVLGETLPVQAKTPVLKEATRGQENSTPELPVARTNPELKSAGLRSEAAPEAQAKADQRAAGDSAVRANAAEAKPKAERPADPAAPEAKQNPVAEAARMKAASMEKPEGVKIDAETVRQAVSNQPAAFHRVAVKAESRELPEGEGLAGAEKKAQVLSSSPAPQKAENPSVGKPEGREIPSHAERSLPYEGRPSGEIHGKENVKINLQVEGVREAKAASSDPLFRPLSPSQQIMRHLPDADVLNARQIRITLSPAELGTIRISFQREGDEITGLIQAQRPEVRRDIEQAMGQIVSVLQQQGLQVRRIDVSMMGDMPQQKDQSGFTGDPSMQREFAQSGQSESGRGGYSSNGRAASDAEELVQELPTDPENRRGGYTGSGLNFYI